MNIQDIKAINITLHLWAIDEDVAESIADYIYSLRDKDYTVEELQAFLLKNDESK